MFQAPGMPEGLFESQYRSLQREFENIRARFAGWISPAQPPEAV